MNKPGLSRETIIKLENHVNNLYFKPETEQEEQYLILARAMPFTKMCEYLKEYDNAFPQQDELKFINGIAKEFGVTESEVITRIRSVRRILKIAACPNCGCRDISRYRVKATILPDWWYLECNKCNYHIKPKLLQKRAIRAWNENAKKRI